MYHSKSPRNFPSFLGVLKYIKEPPSFHPTILLHATRSTAIQKEMNVDGKYQEVPTNIYIFIPLLSASEEFRESEVSVGE